MIIKSMSRKHPSFAQLIDYIEGDAKLKSRQYSIYHNLYSRNSDHIKAEFAENARHLPERKNGVYLYHEVVSITRSQHMADAEQKATLKTIVQDYLTMRAKRNIAYAVLHEDTGDNIHFHIVMSANEAGHMRRTRLSKKQFADIQTALEKWVLEHHPQLEQKAVFYPNMTPAEREARHARKDAREQLSNKGEQLKRRGGKTSIRDEVQEKLADIFASATDPRHFADLMEKAGFTLYQRGNTHGVTDSAGNKYRLARLGLADAWHDLDERMTAQLQAHRQAETMPDREAATTRPGENATPQVEAPTEAKTVQDLEAEKRLEEIHAMRAHKASRQQAHNTYKGRER